MEIQALLKTSGAYLFYKRNSGWVISAVSVALLLAMVLPSLFVGAYPIPAGRAARLLLSSVWPFHRAAQYDLRELTIMTIIRPPRVLVAMFGGIALGLSGAALQGMMRNPLIGPDLVGVSSGAAFGSVLGMMFGFSSVGIAGLAFAGGLTAMACTMALAKLVHVRNDGVPLILAGFFVGAFFMAGVGLIERISPVNGPGIVYWLLGTFRGANTAKLEIVAIPTLIGGTLLMFLRWRINLLSLGDMDAASLGIDVHYLRWALIAIVAWLVSAQVAVSGTIGWVGLIVPHCARMLVGPDHRRLLPTSGLLGGVLVLGLDNYTRTTTEVPVGFLTALVGTPLICFLFWKTQSRGWNRA